MVNKKQYLFLITCVRGTLRKKYIVFLTLIVWENNYGQEHFYSYYCYNISNSNLIYTYIYICYSYTTFYSIIYYM